MRDIQVPLMIDPHFHLREGENTMMTLIEAAIQGGVGVIGPMPNTKAGLTTAKSVDGYINTARSLGRGKMDFIPIGMLNEHTTEAELLRFAEGQVQSLKVYPLNRTTKSENGVRNYHKLIDRIAYAAELGIKIHFHPEHPLMDIGNRDAEYLFVPIVDMFMQNTDAIIIWEHGTDGRCIPFWEEWAKTGRFFVTLTPHHLLTTEDETFGDVRSVCKPPIKTVYDRNALRALVAKDYPWVMAGSDCAYHPHGDKHVEQGCCACGAFMAPYVVPLYAHALDDLLQTQCGVEVFGRFINGNASRLHELKVNGVQILRREASWKVPLHTQIGSYQACNFWAGKEILWRRM